MSKQPAKQNLAPQDLIQVLRPLSEAKAVLVGGQAIWLWIELFRRNSTALRKIGPVSSADVDFFGLYETAKQLADAFNSIALKPTADAATPNTAQVKLDINGSIVVVDFIGHVYGIADDKRILARAISVDLEAALNVACLRIKVLHPVHCLFSRTANTLSKALHRRDQHSIRQLKASFHIARRWIILKLNENSKISLKEAKCSLKELFKWARSDEYGKILANKYPELNPVLILREAQRHENLDHQYTIKTLGSMIAKLVK